MNRDDVYNEIKDLQSHLIDLQSKRQNLHLAETRRSLLSKQAALITEAESLGTAIRSHPLNTLSQRYGVYKRTRDEYNACKAALLDKSVECSAKLSTYLTCLENVESNAIADYLMQLNEIIAIVKSQSPTFEFELVREFLENSAQTAIYVQSCQTYTELHNELLQQFAIVKQIFDTILQYGAVARYHPRFAHEQHRIAKYSEWCRYLSEHRSVQDCRDIVTQFQTTVGKNALSKIPLQQVVTFSYQLQTIIGEGQFGLQNALEALNMELNHEDVSMKVLQISQCHEETKCAINVALCDDSSIRKCLEAAALSRLTELNAQLLTMEHSIAKSDDNSIDLTINGKWFVEELLSHSTLIFDLCRLHDLGDGINHITKTISYYPHMDEPIRTLQSIRNIYIHLCFMNETFFNKTLGDILHGIISEDKSVLNMISAVSSLQEGLLPVPELLTNLHLQLRRVASSGVPATSTAFLSAESTIAQAVSDARLLRNKLRDMRTSFENSDTVSTGQILFLEFNGMFDTLEECHQRSIELMQKIHIPDEWRHLDQIKDSFELAVNLFA